MIVYDGQTSEVPQNSQKIAHLIFLWREKWVMKKTYEVPNAKMNTRVPHRIENKIPSLNS